MKKLLWLFHRRVILRMVTFWYSRWGEKSFLVMLACLIGVLTALLAAGLHVMVGYLEKLSIQWSMASKQLHEYWWLAVLLVLPMVGLFLSYLVQRYLGGPRYAKSLSPLILSLNRKRTNIPFSEVFTHALSSALSVGLGGSAGLEAPSVLTGSALGSNLGGVFRIDRKKRSLLIGCGAAGAISAIFGSPIAGVLFAAEVLLPEFSVSALIPMLMSSAVAAVISRWIIGEHQIIPAINEKWELTAIPFYFLLGLTCAIIGVYVIRMAYRMSDILKERYRNPWRRLFTGGALLCILLLIFPPLRGQGYMHIIALFNEELGTFVEAMPLLSWIPSETAIIVIVMLAAIFVKVIASVLTVDSGGDGGIFAPSMFIGAFVGFAFAKLINMSGLVHLQVFNFVAVGMCGVFTAVMRAPLTGIFLIAEVTNSYILLVPLMIVSSISYFAANFFEPHSIYRKALVEGNLISDNREQSILRRQAIRLNIDKNYHPLAQGARFKDITDLMDRYDDEAFPVLDENHKLLGIVNKNKIITAMLNPEVCNYLLAFDIMDEPQGGLSPDDDLARALAAMDVFKAKQLPVCVEQTGEFLGFVRKEAIFSKYRGMVQEADGL